MWTTQPNADTAGYFDAVNTDDAEAPGSGVAFPTQAMAEAHCRRMSGTATDADRAQLAALLAMIER